MPRGIPNSRSRFERPDAEAIREGAGVLPGAGGGTAVQQAASIPAKGRKLPSIAILDENFGFMDNGCLRHWKEGETVTDPSDIAQLVARNAPFKDLGHG